MSDGFIYQTYTIAAAQYFNTVVIFLVTYASWTDNVTHNRGFLFVGTLSDFSPSWYLLIATPIVISLMLQIATPHLSHFFLSLCSAIRRCYDRKFTLDRRSTKKVIQQDYEDLYTGPEFQLQIRTAQLMSLIFVTMTFSGGCPGMYIVSFICILGAYWTDKILLLRYYRLMDHKYKQYLSAAVVNMLPWCVVFHLVMSTWMLSYP